MNLAWRVEERLGDPGALHSSWPSVLAAPAQPAVAVCRVTERAIVLGSTQSEAVVDAERAARAGISLVRRRSGGGAVLVAPGEPLWLDVWLPSSHPQWDPDVARSFVWLGHAWVGALAQVGIGGLRVHDGTYLARTRWSRLVCFGGVGSGEVLTADGRKVVGLAQRRNRDGAWFHGACILRWDPSLLLDVVSLPAAERQLAIGELGDAVVGAVDLAEEAGTGPVTGAALAAALASSLP